ncbi:MAG: transcription termination/antitermination NusG family protein [Minwuia sp.]|nr:transcription termination/antitermination NusG family protein [Minwuia sp.]
MADSETTEIWFLAQLKPNCARIAVRNLERQGFRTFQPLQQETVRRETRFAHRIQPLFPGYLFVAVDARDGGWTAINGTQGVTRLVSFGSRPSTVPGDLVEALMARCDSSGRLLPEVTVKTGDEVVMTGGAFAEFIGRVEHVDADQRVWVLLDILGRTTRVGVTPDKLRVA